MTDTVAISICIPAYKNTTFLRRLLDSIAIQQFRNFEVVVTDDSPDDSISDFLHQYPADFPIRYVKNPKALGTPGNWNEGLRQARGTWVKLMHDDDWFADPDALGAFHRATLEHPQTPFHFAAFTNVHEDTGRLEPVTCSPLDLALLRLSPLVLFRRVYVGNPSCTLVRRDTALFYDEEYKWAVDFEYYIRLLRRSPRFHYIDRRLLNIGFNALQVTRYTFLVREVQIPEYVSLLWKLGPRILRNPFVYDNYWRLFRNLGIRNLSDVEGLAQHPLPPAISRMIRFQRHIPLSILRQGLLSKPLMLLSYAASLAHRVGPGRGEAQAKSDRSRNSP